MRPFSKFQLSVFCLAACFFWHVDSLKCLVCDTGKCTGKLESKECAAAAPAGGGGATTTAAAARLIEGQDATTAAAAPAAGGGGGLMKCVVWEGKSADGKENLVFRGCSSAGTCAEFKDKGVTDGKCTPCDEDDCNAGAFVKPIALPLMIVIAIMCLVVSQQ